MQYCFSLIGSLSTQLSPEAVYCAFIGPALWKSRVILQYIKNIMDGQAT